MKKFSIFPLEKYLIHPRNWYKHKKITKAILPIELYNYLFINFNKHPQPIGLGKHPKLGYFVLGTGQDPHKIWTEWIQEEP